MQRRWEYTRRIGRSTHAHSVLLDGDTVTSDHPERRPNPRTASIREVFEQSAFFETSDPRVRLELLREIASSLEPSQLAHTVDRARLAYLRAFDPSRVSVERFAYVRLRKDHSVEDAFAWKLDPLGLFVSRASREDEPEHELFDQAFVAGPPTPHAPAWHRFELRARVASAASSEVGPAFRPIRYRAIPRRDWSWDKNSDGESFAGTSPDYVLVGYQYQHDYGTGTYVPERIMAAPWATRISLHMPADVLREIRASIESAGFEEPPLHVASTDECRAAYAAIAQRASTKTQRAHRETISLHGLDAVSSERQWQGSAALGLFASLCPDRALSHECVIPDARLYEFGQDSIRISTDGAALIKAQQCFGTWAGGVDDWWHVLPSDDRRAAFNIGTDYSQSTIELVLDADTPDALAALRAHCLAYFALLGLKPAAPA
ncbi:MAG: hypothetical protein U0269_36930 [Polyangiales bacterium]